MLLLMLMLLLLLLLPLLKTLVVVGMILAVIIVGKCPAKRWNLFTFLRATAWRLFQQHLIKATVTATAMYLIFKRARLHYLTKPNVIDLTHYSLIIFNNGLGPLKNKSGEGFQGGGRVGGCVNWSNCHVSDITWLSHVVKMGPNLCERADTESDCIYPLGMCSVFCYRPYSRRWFGCNSVLPGRRSSRSTHRSL